MWSAFPDTSPRGPGGASSFLWSAVTSWDIYLAPDWTTAITLTWQQMGFSFYPHLAANGLFILPSPGSKWAFHFTLTWQQMGFSFYPHLAPKWNFHFTLTWHKLGFSFYPHLAPNGLFILSSLGTKWALHFTLTCTRWGHLSSQAPEWMFTCTAALLNLNVVLCVDDSVRDKKYYISGGVHTGVDPPVSSPPCISSLTPCYGGHTSKQTQSYQWLRNRSIPPLSHQVLSMGYISTSSSKFCQWVLLNDKIIQTEKMWVNILFLKQLRKTSKMH